MTALQLRQKARETKAAMESLIQAADAEDRNFTAEEAGEFDRMEAEAKGLLERADRMDATRSLSERLPAEPKADAPKPRTAGAGSETAGRTFAYESDGTPVPVYGRGDLPRAEPQWPALVRAQITGKEPRIEMASTTSVGTAGGYTTFAEQSPGFVIADVLETSKHAEAGGGMFTFTGATFDMAKLTGHPTVSWSGESATIAESDPTFGRLRFEPRKCGVRTTMSRELIEDSANAESLIRQAIMGAIAEEVDRVVFLGSGSGQEPLGIANWPGVQTNSVSGFDYDEFLDSVKLLEDVNAMPSTALMATSVKNTLSKLTETGGQYLIPPSGYTDLRRIVSSKLTADTAIVGDFSGVLVGMRRELTIRVNEGGTTARQDSVELIATVRLDVGITRPNHLVYMS